MKTSLPAALQAHYNQDGTTLCFLLKIVCSDDTVLGVTSNNIDIEYDDGKGVVKYQAPIGLDQSAIHESSGLEVDNSEATMLLVDAGDFTQQKIDAGVFDGAQFWLYRINWTDLTNGHEIRGHGTVGMAKNRGGLSGVLELRGLSQQLKQSVVELYSLTCRAKFGSGGKFGCNFDASGLWDSKAVGTVSADEPDRVFDATSVPSATGPNGALEFTPGLLKFTSGDNAGLQVEIEQVDGAKIELRFPCPYNIASGDEFIARPDCAKRAIEDCEDKFDNLQWFRGEWLIPVGDEGSGQTPGANLPRYNGGSTGPDNPVLP